MAIDNFEEVKKHLKDRCELCGLEDVDLQVHHLIPQQVSRSNKYPKSLRKDEDNFLMLCNECHRMLHAMYSNQELRDSYCTKERILESEEFGKYVKWRKKHPKFKGSSKMSNRRK